MRSKVEHTIAASRSLLEMAEELDELIAHFKVDEVVASPENVFRLESARRERIRGEVNSGQQSVLARLAR
jgi:hypothetical protein